MSTPRDPLDMFDESPSPSVAEWQAANSPSANTSTKGNAAPGDGEANDAGTNAKYRDEEGPMLSEKEVYDALAASDDDDNPAEQREENCPKEHREKPKKKNGTEDNPRYCDVCGQHFAWVLQCPDCEKEWCSKCYTKGYRSAQRGSKRSRKRKSKEKA